MALSRKCAWLVAFTNSSQKISTHLLIMEVDFCSGLCIVEMPVLTKSSKFPASIAKSNKQWVGTCDLHVSGGVQALSDKLRGSYLGMSK